MVLYAVTDWVVVVVVVVVVHVVVVDGVCSSSVTGFCRDAVYSLTTDYNNGALRCDWLSSCSSCRK